MSKSLVEIKQKGCHIKNFRVIERIILCVILLFAFKTQAQIFTGFSLGTEINEVLGYAYNFGLDIDLKNKKNTYGFYFNMDLGNNSKTELFIQDSSEIYKVGKIGSAIISLEYGRELYRNHNLLFETVTGLGYKNTTYYHDQEQNLDYDKNSIVLSAGLSFRYIAKNFYIELKPIYGYTKHHHHLLSKKVPSNIIRLNLIVGQPIGN